MKKPCPCHSGQTYEQCCAPLHQGQPAPSAARLMRSRYSAYGLQLDGYLRQSWHKSTRPNDLTKADLQGITWNKLEVIDTQKTSDQAATVTFKAYFNVNDAMQTLHETSRFVLEGNHWFYVDGIIHSDD